MPIIGCESGQEESRNIPENVTWGQRKRFADGKVSMPYKRFLDYEKGEDAIPSIVESEAEIVRMMYRMFMEGKTSSAIAKVLTSSGIPSPGGKSIWQVATVDSFLTNEKYKGDALLQKRFTVDFLTKKIKDNEGEVPQYYVQNSHPAIIVPDEFDTVQVEIERRKKLGRPTSCQSPLSTKLICGECGGFYGSKVWGSNTKYRRIIWQCNDKYKGDKKCTTPLVTEEEVKLEFIASFNKMMGYRNELISKCRLAQKTLSDSSEIDAELNALRQKIEVVSELSRKSINENALTAINQEEWHKRHESYMARIRVAPARVVSLEVIIRDRLRRRRNIDLAISGLLSCEDSIDSFDERLWLMIVDHAVVMADRSIVFAYRDGIAGTRDE